jgi:hypothetical protein
VLPSQVPSSDSGKARAKRKSRPRTALGPYEGPYEESTAHRARSSHVIVELAAVTVVAMGAMGG